MVFLNPAVLFGLLAASIPVLIHLLNLRKLKKIEFSTLTFLKELQKNKIRRVKLKQWLLLFLRVMIILLIVLAFARPTLEGVALGGSASAAKTTAVFILDDTFSISVVDQNGSLFNQAKQSIKSILTNFQEGDEVGIIRVSQSQKEDYRLTSDIPSFQDELDLMKISYTSGMIHDAFITAAEILSISDNYNKEVYILSDFQSGRLSDELTETDFSQILDKNTRVYFVNYSGKDVFNLSIEGLDLASSILELNKPIIIQTTVRNHSNQKIENALVSVFLGEERSAQKSLTLASGESQFIEIEVVPKKSGFTDLRIELEDDDILYDNLRHLNFYIPEKLSVLILADQTSDTDFLELALRTVSSSANYSIEVKPSSQILSVDFTKYQTVFLIGEVVSSGHERINKFVLQGGGLIVFPPSKSQIQNYNLLCDKIGLNKAQNAYGKLGSDSNAILFDKIDYDHPLLSNLFSDSNKKKIDSPELNYYYKINLSSTGKSVISLSDGSSFLSEYKVGKGKIFQFNSTPNLSWTNFPLKGIFPAIINKSVLYLSALEQNKGNYFAGDIITFNVQSSTFSQVKIVSPSGDEEIINLHEQNKGDYLQYSNTRDAGNYKIYSEEKLLDVVSVNTDPAESINKYLSKSEIEKYFDETNFPGSLIEIGKTDDPSKLITQARFGSELWKYFLIAAFLLALIEMIVARNTKKETEGITEVN